MEIIYLLIPLSLVLVGVALWAFFWAVRNGQFDDLDSPALDILDHDAESPGLTENDVGSEQNKLGAEQPRR